MSAESGICFFEHSGCQAVSTDHDDRVEMVGQCAVNLALGRGKLYLSHDRIIKGKMKTRTPGKKVNKAWLHDHINDPYVKQAQRDGYRARAAYKLK